MILRFNLINRSSGNTAFRKRRARFEFGRAFEGGRIRALKELNEEEPDVVVEGEIFNIDENVMKTGRVKLKVSLTDGTDSIWVILWFEDKVSVPKEIKKGIRVRVKGKVAPDRFEQDEMVLMEIAGMIPIESRPGREDKADVKRVELHAHTKMSAGDSVTEIAAYIQQAARWGHPAVGITDHGVVHAFPKAAQVAKKGRYTVIAGG